VPIGGIAGLVIQDIQQHLGKLDARPVRLVLTPLDSGMIANHAGKGRTRILLDQCHARTALSDQ
jgi:hypothetical protein